MISEVIMASRIVVVEGRLPLNEAVVASLMESMAAVGLLNAITVYRDVGRQPVLVAGRHRLEAARRLGWETILCRVMPSEGLDAQIAEIDENLVRQVLSPTAVADLIGWRKGLYEGRHPEAAAGSIRASAANRAMGRDVAANLAATFAAHTSKATGKSERSIRRAATRSDRLGTAALVKVAGTSLDKGAELDALSKMPPAERAPLIERAAAGEPVTAKAPQPSRAVRIASAFRADWDELSAPERASLSPVIRKILDGDAE